LWDSRIASTQTLGDNEVTANRVDIGLAIVFQEVFMHAGYRSIIVFASLAQLSCGTLNYQWHPLTERDEERKLINASKLGLSKGQAMQRANQYMDGRHFETRGSGHNPTFAWPWRQETNYLGMGVKEITSSKYPGPNAFPDKPVVITFREDGFSFPGWGYGGGKNTDGEWDEYQPVHFKANCVYSDSVIIRVLPAAFPFDQRVDLSCVDRKMNTNFWLLIYVDDTKAFFELVAALQVLMPNAKCWVYNGSEQQPDDSRRE
jgi:hypothetical protein